MYKRVLIKLSGEALAGDKKTGLDDSTLQSICASIKKIYDLGTEIAIVVGGGNFWRGRSSGNMDRTRADHIGMLATAMNALALADALERVGCDVACADSNLHAAGGGALYPQPRGASSAENRVVIFGCGTGNPFFSTDTAASLRAAEIDAQVILKATMVDGVYDSDPHKNPNAKRYSTISFDQILSEQLGVMDMTAASMCRDNNIRSWCSASRTRTTLSARSSRKISARL